MKTAITIFFILVAIFALAVIVASVRRAIHKSREIKRRLAEITRDEYRQIHPSVKEKWDTCREVTSAPRRVGMHPALGVGYGQHVPAERLAFNPDTDEFFPANQLPGTCPLCDGFLEHAPDCPQFILAVMGEEPIRGEYVDPDTHVITVTTLPPGEPLPQSPPNIGGIGHPDYRGANYVEPEEIADEMKGIIQWDSPDGEEFPADQYRKD